MPWSYREIDHHLNLGMRFKTILPLGNLIACALFVLLREPASPEYLREVDQARAAGGMYWNSAIEGTLACRNLYSWSEFHGGEALGVKILEVVNLPALVVTAGAGVFGLDIARLTTACRWSWVLAGVFLMLSSAQWWLLGARLDERGRRSPGPQKAQNQHEANRI